MRKQEFEADRWPQAFANYRQEEFNPAHQAIEQALPFRMHLVYKAVERLLVPLDEIDKLLHSPNGVLLADYEIVD